MKDLSQGYHERGSDYKNRCALAEKLADIQLRKWCVEQIGLPMGPTPDFTKVDSLFSYIKNRDRGTND